MYRQNDKKIFASDDDRLIRILINFYEIFNDCYFIPGAGRRL
jgi:hypothetical protein